MAWPVRTLTAAELAGDSSWVVLADASFAASIGRVLGTDSQASVLALSVLADETETAELLDALGGATNLLYAPDVSSTDFDAESGYRLFSGARRLTALLGAMASPPRIFMLTRSASGGSDGAQASPATAVSWALGRALALAHPDNWGGIIDVDDTAADADADEPGGVVHRDDGAGTPVGDIKDSWRLCEPEQRRSLLRDHVAMLVSAVMGLPSPQSLSPMADFFELGMDSLMNVILQRALTETLGVELPQSVVFDYATVEELADHLVTIADGDEFIESELSEKVG